MHNWNFTGNNQFAFHLVVVYIFFAEVILVISSKKIQQFSFGEIAGVLLVITSMFSRIIDHPELAWHGT